MCFTNTNTDSLITVLFCRHDVLSILYGPRGQRQRNPPAGRGENRFYKAGNRRNRWQKKQTADERQGASDHGHSSSDGQTSSIPSLTDFDLDDNLRTLPVGGGSTNQGYRSPEDHSGLRSHGVGRGLQNYVPKNVPSRFAKTHGQYGQGSMSHEGHSDAKSNSMSHRGHGRHEGDYSHGGYEAAPRFAQEPGRSIGRGRRNNKLDAAEVASGNDPDSSQGQTTHGQYRGHGVPSKSQSPRPGQSESNRKYLPAGRGYSPVGRGRGAKEMDSLLDLYPSFKMSVQQSAKEELPSTVTQARPLPSSYHEPQSHDQQLGAAVTTIDSSSLLLAEDSFSDEDDDALAQDEGDVIIESSSEEDCDD